MPDLADCPQVECWEAVLDGTAPPDQRQDYEAHLESCPACQQRLDRAEEAGSPLRTLARRLGDPTATLGDPTLARFLERLHARQPSASPGTREAVDLYFLSPSDRPDVLGTLGGSEVLEVIGQGGMGVVLKAYEPALDRLVAIKVLSPALAGSATARRRFTREARAAAAVCHEHVVPGYRVAEADGLPYLVMQYIPGESLQDRLDRTGPLEVEEVVRIGHETAAGLAAAHAQGLIHRDVKPANFLLENGVARVKITDFGLARMIDDVGLTQQGVLAGTPEYVAPEQARGEFVDHRADLYGLGGVLYACCTGAPPFRAPTALAVLRRVSDEAPAPIRSLNPDVPAWLEGFIARLLAKDPADRLQTAAKVAALLEGYLAHLRQPVAVPAPPLPPAPESGRSGEPGACRRFAPWGWPFALILLGVGLVGALLLLHDGPAPAPAPSGDFYQDFRGGQPPLPPLHLAGPDAAALTRPEQGGFRTTLPKDRKQADRVGLASDTRIKGDFEITVGYEILKEEQPVQGHGVAFDLIVETDTPRHDVVELARATRVGEGEVYNCARISTDDEGKRTYEHSFPPAFGVRGRLRLTRSGREVTLSAADADAGEFTELTSYDLGPEDVTKVSATGFTGYAPNFLDLRILDFRVRVPGAAQAGAPAPPATGHRPGPPRAWWAAAAALGLLVLCTALLAWLVMAQRRRGRSRPALPLPAGGPAPGPAEEPKAAPPLAFPCPGCGKSLRARPALAGKRVKCPQCGGAALVPSLQAGEPGSTA
jgi:hypothetical protein